MITASSTYSCNVCQIEFTDNALQRAHTKTDWHVYNLKRRVAVLPPLTLEVFLESIVRAKELSTSSNEEKVDSEASVTCSICHQSFHSPKAYQTHLQSPHHASCLLSTDSLEISLEALSLSPISPTPKQDFSPTRCLFCTTASPALAQNLTHMSISHGFFISDHESLIDIETFLNYLSTIITEFRECLYCGKVKDSAEAVRQHMLSVGHCKLPEEMGEFEEFWDFGEEDESDEDGESKGKGKLRIEMPVPFDEQLHLPSGRTVGHRSQAQRKNPSTISRLAERKAIEDLPSSKGVESRQVGTRNANLGVVGVSESQRRAVVVLEKKMLKRATRARNQYQARVEKGGNKQKHFKPDVPGPSNG